MANEHKRGMKPAERFNFGLRALRDTFAVAATPAKPATSATPRALHPPRPPRVRLTLDERAPEKAGFDPYNTSGSFDRSKNWARVGKR